MDPAGGVLQKISELEEDLDKAFEKDDIKLIIRLQKEYEEFEKQLSQVQ